MITLIDQQQESTTPLSFLTCFAEVILVTLYLNSVSGQWGSFSHLVAVMCVDTQIYANGESATVVLGQYISNMPNSCNPALKLFNPGMVIKTGGQLIGTGCQFEACCKPFKPEEFGSYFIYSVSTQYVLLPHKTNL